MRAAEQLAVLSSVLRLTTVGGVEHVCRTDEPLEMLFNVGDRVRTTKYGDGVVRYFGPHKVRTRLLAV